jgi:RNA polymerase sigma factor (TIGR02999 family)
MGLLISCEAVLPIPATGLRHSTSAAATEDRGESARALRTHTAGGMLTSMSEVTRILSAIEQGEPSAATELLPLVYDELRKLAAQRLAQEKPGQTLQATALVHEAYLRLVDADKVRQWNSRGHFFAAAAEAMRRILVDQARRRLAAKRGGSCSREELQESAIAAPENVEEMLAIHDVLDHLAAADGMAADVVKLRFFAAMTMDEVAQALNVSVRTAYDLWAYARVWLHHHLRTD